MNSGKFILPYCDLIIPHKQVKLLLELRLRIEGLIYILGDPNLIILTTIRTLYYKSAEFIKKYWYKLKLVFDCNRSEKEVDPGEFESPTP